MIDMSRRGQYLSLLTVFTLAFIGSGHIFSEVAQGTIISGEADRAVGDPERVTEAKVYSEIYKERVPAMTNYSVINAAYDLSEEDYEFSDSSDADSSVWMSDWMDRADENLEGRNRVNSFRCSSIEAPELEIVDLSTEEAEVDILDDFVVCEDRDIDVHIDLDVDSFDVELEGNRFDEVLDSSSDAADIIDDEVDTGVFEGSYNSECVESVDSSLIDDTEGEAAEEAFDEMTNDVFSGLADYDWPSGFDHSLSVDPDEDDADTSHVIDDEECSDDDERVEAEATLDVSEIDYLFEVVDEDNTVLTSDGEVNLGFEFTFVVN